MSCVSHKKHLLYLSRLSHSNVRVKCSNFAPWLAMTHDYFWALKRVILSQTPQLLRTPLLCAVSQLCCKKKQNELLNLQFSVLSNWNWAGARCVSAPGTQPPGEPQVPPPPDPESAGQAVLDAGLQAGLRGRAGPRCSTSTHPGPAAGLRANHEERTHGVRERQQQPQQPRHAAHHGQPRQRGECTVFWLDVAEYMELKTRALYFAGKVKLQRTKKKEPQTGSRMDRLWVTVFWGFHNILTISDFLSSLAHSWQKEVFRSVFSFPIHLWECRVSSSKFLSSGEINHGRALHRDRQFSN